LINFKNYLQAPSASPPTTSKSNRLIAYAPSPETPLIGHGAPTLEDILAGKKRKPSSTKATTRMVPMQGSSSQQVHPSVAPSSAQVTDLPIVDISDSLPIGNQLALNSYAGII